MNQPDPIALLRAAGEDRAADLLVALQPTQPAEGEPPATPAPSSTPAVAAMNPAEGQREAEGQALLAALYRSIPDLRPDTEPAS